MVVESSEKKNESVYLLFFDVQTSSLSQLLIIGVR